MNPDTSSPGEDESAALEDQLRAIPQPVLPDAWRGPILRAAAAAAPLWPWFTKPVRRGLAACWAAIAFFQFTAPPGPTLSPAGARVPSPSPPPSAMDFDQQWLAGAGEEAPIPTEIPAP